MEIESDSYVLKINNYVLFNLKELDEESAPTLILINIYPT